MGKPPTTLTIKDVARRAGVSTATVSHVLNKTRFVSEELTTRVNDAIHELGYYPNLLVGSLRKKKTYTVGLVLASISNETFGLLAETIQKMLFNQGYNLIICNTSNDGDLEREAFNTLLMKKVDAIITVPTGLDGDKLKEIKAIGIPVILVDRVIPGIGLDTVRVDNYKGAYMATEHLIGLGHQVIGYIDRKIDKSHSIEQRTAYLDALQAHGLTCDPANIVRADGYDYKAGMEAARALIRKTPRLTAILAYYDIAALGAMRGIFDLGYRVPEEVSVVGYDDMSFTDATWPRLTTVSFPVHRIARTVCDLLMKRLDPTECQDEKGKDIVIVPKLVVRDSTAPPRREGIMDPELFLRAKGRGAK